MFLAKYRVMFGKDCKRIYKSKDYHRKRLKVLEKEKYIRRINNIYIKLDDKGTKLIKDFGYDYKFTCRKREYIDRLNEIARIAALTIDSNIEFTASWDLKDNNIYTQTSRKYIGKLNYQGKDYIVYYISKEKQIPYISQTLNDIQKLINYKNVIVFSENLNVLNDNSKFIFGNESTLIINPTEQNFDIIRKLDKIDIYNVLKLIYPNQEILLSNWKKADYMTEDKCYIFVMPFINTERLKALSIYFRNNQRNVRNINIITLKENIDKITEILKFKVNIIEMDKFLDFTERKIDDILTMV